METNNQHLNVREQWLALAPSPPPPPEDKKWHVFLSYRSVNRPWVLHLFDALEQAGFEVFLDQFELVPGEALVTSLQNALDQSASGVIVWSTENRDSAWCEDEYNAMHSMKNERGSTFRFVVVKLDKTDLPRFARSSLYGDFSESPEGPRGYELLRVMCGLVGQPPSEEAVKFATKVDQETKDSLAKIEAAKLEGDADWLVDLSKSESMAWQASPLLPCQAAQALIDLGSYDKALGVLESAEEHFPKSIRPKQLRALALARLGQYSEARKVLSVLYVKGHRDPETLGIYARTWMDRYKETKNLLHLEKSRNLYAEAFKHDPSDYYTGINAASKSVLLDDLDAAKGFAAKVEELVGTKVIEGDYWQTATVGEVQLIQQNYDEAARLYRAAVLIDLEAIGSHESTLGQAKLLMDHLNTPPEQRKKIEQAFV